MYCTLALQYNENLMGNYVLGLINESELYPSPPLQRHILTVLAAQWQSFPLVLKDNVIDLHVILM